jgi:hypothetical protein
VAVRFRFTRRPPCQRHRHCSQSATRRQVTQRHRGAHCGATPRMRASARHQDMPLRQRHDSMLQAELVAQRFGQLPVSLLDADNASKSFHMVWFFHKQAALLLALRVCPLSDTRSTCLQRLLERPAAAAAATRTTHLARQRGLRRHRRHLPFRSLWCRCRAATLPCGFRRSSQAASFATVAGRASSSTRNMMAVFQFPAIRTERHSRMAWTRGQCFCAERRRSHLPLRKYERVLVLP